MEGLYRDPSNIAERDPGEGFIAPGGDRGGRVCRVQWAAARQTPGTAAGSPEEPESPPGGEYSGFGKYRGYLKYWGYLKY